MKKEPCKTCPFVKGTENHGAPDWLLDVGKGLEKGLLDHSCHVTDPKACGFVGGRKQPCWGFLAMIHKTKHPCISIEGLGFMADNGVDFKDLPTKKVFDRVEDFMVHHARHIMKELGPK